MVGEGDAQAVDADVPGEGVVGGRGLEVREEGDCALEGGEKGGGDGGEAGVVEGTVSPTLARCRSRGEGKGKGGCTYLVRA